MHLPARALTQSSPFAPSSELVDAPIEAALSMAALFIESRRNLNTMLEAVWIDKDTFQFSAVA
jgi:hypothetical protein